MQSRTFYNEILTEHNIHPIHKTKMIKDKITDEELEMLEEAGALKDISHMPSRVKCAVLGWHTLEEMLKGGDSDVSTEDQ